MIDKLIEIGRCYGMEMNVEKTKVCKMWSICSKILESKFVWHGYAVHVRGRWLH
jgi:hypothetical protein